MNYLISELGSIPDAVEFMPPYNIAYMEFGDVLTHSSLTLGTLLEIMDGALVVITVTGLYFMFKDRPTKESLGFFPVTSITIWATAICGLLGAVTKLVYDWIHNFQG